MELFADLFFITLQMFKDKFDITVLEQKLKKNRIVIVQIHLRKNTIPKKTLQKCCFNTCINKIKVKF